MFCFAKILHRHYEFNALPPNPVVAVQDFPTKSEMSPGRPLLFHSLQNFLLFKTKKLYKHKTFAFSLSFDIIPSNIFLYY